MGDEVMDQREDQYARQKERQIAAQVDVCIAQRPLSEVERLRQQVAEYKRLWEGEKEEVRRHIYTGTIMLPVVEAAIAFAKVAGDTSRHADARKVLQTAVSEYLQAQSDVEAAALRILKQQMVRLQDLLNGKRS